MWTEPSEQTRPASAHTHTHTHTLPHNPSDWSLTTTRWHRGGETVRINECVSDCLCLYARMWHRDDVCVWGARGSLDVVWGDVCISLMCIHVDVRARDLKKKKCGGAESVLVGAWFMSANILSPRSFQIVLYVRLCLVTKSGLGFPQIHLPYVRLMNFFFFCSGTLCSRFASYGCFTADIFLVYVQYQCFYRGLAAMLVFYISDRVSESASWPRFWRRTVSELKHTSFCFLVKN